MALKLLSDTPDFHSLAMAITQDEPDSYLAQVLSLRMGDMRVGDPFIHEADVPPAPAAIESGLSLISSEPVTVREDEIHTTMIPQIDLLRRQNG